LATARAAASASAKDFRAVDAHGHDAMHAFAVAHNHLRQFKTNMIQCSLEISDF
jgi:hypothetical protein